QPCAMDRRDEMLKRLEEHGMAFVRCETGDDANQKIGPREPEPSPCLRLRRQMSVGPKRQPVWDIPYATAAETKSPDTYRPNFLRHGHGVRIPKQRQI